jgi:hypothetical protein
MASITSMAIRIDELLGLWRKKTSAMFCSVVVGEKLDLFFPPEKP